MDFKSQQYERVYTRPCSFVLLALLMLLGSSAELRAATVTATWSPNPEPNIAGYQLSYGTKSGTYTTTIDVGKVTSTAVTLADNTTYYVAVRAYNTAGLVGPYSAEATVSTAATPTPPSGSASTPSTPTTPSTPSTGLPSSVAFVQQASAVPASAATVAVPFPAAQSTGNLNVVVVGWSDSVRTVQSVTDSKGNMYTRAVGPTVLAGQVSQSIYYANNIVAAAAGSNTVTVTFNGTANAPDVRVAEYRGLDPVNPLDGGIGSSGTAPTSDSGAWTTTTASDLLVGANTVTGHVTAPGAGFTSRVITSPDGDILEDQVVTSLGTYHATAPVSSGSWVMQLVAFRVATTSSSAPVITSMTPTSGPSGTSVTIAGANFGSTKGTSTVTFNGMAATPSNWSATSIVVPVPSGATTGNVSVAVAGTASNGQPFTVTTPGSIGFVQSNYSAPQAPTASVVVPFTAAQTAGNLNVVVIGWNDSTQAVRSVVDSSGNVYTNAVGPTALSGQLTQSIYYAKNIAAAATGANTVTVAFTGAAVYPDVRVAEYRGLDPANPLDGAIGATGASTTSDSGALLTTSPTDLLVGGNTVTSRTTAAGAGYTSRLITSPDGDILEDRIVTVTGSYNATAPLTTGSWVMQLAAFRAAPGSGASSPAPSLASVSPGSGPVGTPVTITGSNFGSTKGTSTVTFNGTMATPTSWSTSGIVVPVPTGATSGNVVVTVGGTPSNGRSFTVTASGPVIASLTPASGSVGTTVTIAGSAFGSTKGTSTVTFNGTTATPTSWSATSIVVPVPTGATTGNVVVTVNGAASNGVMFAVTRTAAISFVQKNSATPQTPASSVSVPFTAAQTAGDMNVVVVGWSDSSHTVQSVKDSAGNVYASAVGPTVLTGQLSQSIYYAKNIAAAAAGANSVTVAFNGPAAYPDVRIAEYSGLDPASPLDGAAGATGTALTSDSGPVVTTSASDLLVGANTVTAHTTAAGTAFISRVITSPDGDILEDRVVSATGSYDATAPVSGGSWVMQVVAYRAATVNVVGAAMMSAAAQLPTPDDSSRASDYDGDGRADLAVFTPATGKWSVLQSSSNYMNSFSLVLGASTDIPVPGDYDGDGKTDVAIFTPSTGKWTVMKSSSAFASSMSTSWGTSGDIPVPGDYDGDGKTDFAIYRPSTGEWWLTLSATQTTRTIVLGTAGDKPVAGDYDGDGRTDLAIFRPSTGTWIVLTSSSNYSSQVTGSVGTSSDLLVPGDYDGDGRTDMAVYRPSTGSWLILGSATGFRTTRTVTLGSSADIPVPSDYDADGIIDVAIYRPTTGQWSIVKSSDGSTLTSVWGTSGADVPLPRHP